MFLVWQLFTRAVSAGMLLRTSATKREHILWDLHFSAVEGHLILAVFCVSWEDKALSSYQVFKTFAKYGTDCFNAIIPPFFSFFSFFNHKYYCTIYKYIKKTREREREGENIVLCLNSSIMWMFWHSSECQNPLAQIPVHHRIFTNPCFYFYGNTAVWQTSDYSEVLSFAWNGKPGNIPFWNLVVMLMFFAPSPPVL